MEKHTERRVFAAFDWEWQMRVLRDGAGEPVQVDISPVLDEQGSYPVRLLGHYSDFDELATEFNRLAAASGGWVAGAVMAAILCARVAAVRTACLPAVRALAQVCAPPVLQDVVLRGPGTVEAGT